MLNASLAIAFALSVSAADPPSTTAKWLSDAIGKVQIGSTTLDAVRAMYPDATVTKYGVDAILVVRKIAGFPGLKGQANVTFEVRHGLVWDVAFSPRTDRDEAFTRKQVLRDLGAPLKSVDEHANPGDTGPVVNVIDSWCPAPGLNGLGLVIGSFARGPQNGDVNQIEIIGPTPANGCRFPPTPASVAAAP